LKHIFASKAYYCIQDSLKIHYFFITETIQGEKNPVILVNKCNIGMPRKSYGQIFLSISAVEELKTSFLSKSCAYYFKNLKKSSFLNTTSILVAFKEKSSQVCMK